MSVDNVALVRGVYDAFFRGDMNAVLDALDADVEWHTPGPSDMPTAGTRRGPAAVLAFFGILGEHFEFDQFELQAFLADGDRVVVLGRNKLKVKVTSKWLNESWAHVYTLRGGKVVAFHEYLDTADVIAEIRKASRVPAPTT